jgi:putative ABC transport system permease protein
MNRYLIMAFRNLRLNKFFSLVNALGFSLSLLACFLLITYLVNEFSFDKTYSKGDRIYRLNVLYKGPGYEAPWPCAPPALASFLPEAHPSIEKVARLYQADFSHRLNNGETSYIETRIFYADSLFLEMLDYPLLSGDRITALDWPNSILLTRNAAMKYFGTTDVLGKQLVLNQTRTLTITGVLENIPQTSHLDFDYLFSFSTFQIPLGYTDDFTSWRWNEFITYVQLTPHAVGRGVEETIRKIWVSNITLESGEDINIRLQPVREIYLGSLAYAHPYLSRHFRTGNITILYGLLGAVGVLLLIAIFNFTNIAMANFVKRARNISIHKILGSPKREVMFQFLMDAITVTILSAILAGVLLIAFENQLSDFIGYSILQVTPQTRYIIALLILLSLFVVVLSVLYPVLVSNRLNILQVLKEGLVIRQSRISLKHVLVFVQLTITAVLLISSLVIQKQLDFVSKKSLGFDKENVIVVRMLGEDMERHYGKLRNVLSANPSVLSVSRCKYMFDGESGGSPLKQRDQQTSEFKSVAVYEAHYDFLKTNNIRLIQGREFSEDFSTDSAEAIILNQAAVKAIGLTGDVIGQEVTLLDWTKKIVGVVEDFNYSSLHNQVRPLVIVMPFTHSTKLFIKVAPGNARETVASLRKDWNSLVPEIPFDFTFLDDQIDTLYRRDQRFSKLITLFATMAIFTACLGLLGVAWFAMNLRLKDVAIHRVLGAGIGRIVFLLTRSFALQILLSLLVAIPAALYLTKKWLGNFAYQIDSTLDSVVIGAALLIVIILGLLFFLSGKVAILNPIKNLSND